MAKFKTDPAKLAAMRKKWKARANLATDIALDPLAYPPRKKRKKASKTGMEEADKLWKKSGAMEVSSQTPSEKKARRQRRFHMLAKKKLA